MVIGGYGYVGALVMSGGALVDLMPDRKRLVLDPNPWRGSC